MATLASDRGGMETQPTIVNAVRLNVAFPLVSVLEEFSLSLMPREVVVAVGPSGSGKSTLLDCLGGLRMPDSGNVSMGVQKRNIGYLMQNTALLPWRNLVTNVTIGAEIMGIHFDRDAAAKLLLETGISDGARILPHEASEGMRQRVALARTFFHDPELVFLDEPFSHIDLPRKLALQKWFLSLVRARSMTAFIVTHDLEDAITIGDRILVFGGPPLRLQREVHAKELRGDADPIRLRSTRAFGELFNLLWTALNVSEMP